MCASSLFAKIKPQPSQVTQFSQMFPDQGSWLTVLPKRKIRIKQLTVHALLAILQYVVFR